MAAKKDIIDDFPRPDLPEKGSEITLISQEVPKRYELGNVCKMIAYKHDLYVILNL